MIFKSDLATGQVKAMLATGFISIAISSAAAAGNFLFRIDGVTPDSSILCDDLAFSEAERLTKFAEDTIGQRIAISDARCVDTGSHGPLARWDIEISYTSDRELPLVSTYDLISYFRPKHTTREACEATIAAEKEVFTRQTKLPVFHAYCVIPTYSSDSWQINVSSFGNPERRPHGVWSNIFGTILGHTRESFTEMMSNEFAKFGFEVAQLTVDNALSHQELAVRYYGDRLVRLEEMKIANFQTPNDCAQVVSETQSVLNAADLKSFGVYCERDPLEGTGAILVTMSETPSAMLIVNPETTYQTLEACEAAKGGVVDHYKNRLQRDIKAGYCSFERSTKSFHVVMIEKKRS